MDNNLERLRQDIIKDVDKRSIASFGEDEFSYDENAEIKCGFTIVQDHIIWLEFCKLAEEMRTTPTLLLFLLEEKFLIAMGRLKPDYRMNNPLQASEPINVLVSDLDETDRFFGLGQNRLVNDSKKGLKEKLDFDDEDPFGTGL